MDINQLLWHFSITHIYNTGVMQALRNLYMLCSVTFESSIFDGTSTACACVCELSDSECSSTLKKKQLNMHRP